MCVWPGRVQGLRAVIVRPAVLDPVAVLPAEAPVIEHRAHRFLGSRGSRPWWFSQLCSRDLPGISWVLGG